MNDFRKLREDINERYVSKGAFLESTLTQDIMEINGNSQKTQTPMAVGVIGGVLGQIIICFQGLFKNYQAECKELFEEPKSLQSFLYVFIDSKLKSEKMSLIVAKEFELFLQNLDKPLQLNEMRVMKE